MQAAICRASAKDAPALASCIAAAYAPYQAQGIALPDMTTGLSRAIDADHVWVARSQDDVIAGLILSIGGDEAYLENIAVHPDHGGKGLARALLGLASAAARDAGCRLMKLTTHREMPHNVALYQHLGWSVTRTQGDKVAMERSLVQD